jgi:cyclopropane fatty-acyl-phospholipid synthase-like methyltransferase
LVNPTVLDLGCGVGGQSVRLAQAGAAVVAVDTHDFSAQFAQKVTEQPQLSNRLRFIHSTIGDFVASATEPVDCVLFQRTLHYLPYHEAVVVLKQLSQLTTDSLYISVTGIDSAVGEHYAGRAVAERERFFALDAEHAETFSIFKPVCLYTMAECVTLLTESGWIVEQVWESAFGNIKVVCRNS